MNILLLLSLRLITKHKIRSVMTALLYAAVSFALLFILTTVCAYTDYMSLMKDAFKDTAIYYKNVILVFAVLGLGAVIMLTTLCGICLLMIRCLKKTAELALQYGFTFRHFFTVLFVMNTAYSLAGGVIGIIGIPPISAFIAKAGLPEINWGFTAVLYLICVVLFAFAVSVFAAKTLSRNAALKPHPAHGAARSLPISDPALLIGLKGFMANPSFSEIAAAAAIILALSGFVSNIVGYASAVDNTEAYDIAFYAYDSSYAGELLASVNYTFGMSRGDLAELEGKEGVSLASAKATTVLEKERNPSKPRILGAGERYAEAKSEFGFDDSDIFTQESVFSYYNDAPLYEIASFIIDGELNSEKFLSGEEMIYVAYRGEYDCNVGDKAFFSKIWYDDLGEAHRKDFSTTVGAIVDTSAMENVKGFPIEFGFLTSDVFLSSLFPEIGYNFTFLYLDDPSLFNEVNSAVASVKQRLEEESDGFVYINDSMQERVMAADFSAVTDIIGASVNIVLMFISLFYLVSYILVKIENQEHLFSLLRILGMSKAKIIMSVIIENLLNALWSLIIGTAAGICCILFTQSLLEAEISLMLLMPFRQLLLFSLLFMLCVALTSAACALRISDKIIDK